VLKGPSKTALSAVAPDLIHRVFGFRKWRVVGEQLTSPYIPLRWDRPVVRARCFPANRTLLFGAGWLDDPHEAPHPRCRCGVYAWHRLPSPGPVPDPDRAFGVVELWGRIEVHADGMRAEHAAIRALGLAAGLGDAHRERMERIARRLSVELVDEAVLPRTALSYGSELPASLLPERAAA
jgi:hypothetical protein